MSIETELPEKFPSLCYGCQNARKPAADSNRLIGWSEFDGGSGKSY